MKIRVRRKNRNVEISDEYADFLNFQYNKSGHRLIKGEDGEYKIDDFDSKWDELNDIWKKAKK